MAVTNNSLANIPFWPYLPMMYTNYGGDTQITTIQPYSGYNLNMSFNPVAQQTWGPISLSTGQQMPSPAIDQQAIIRGAQALLTPALNQLTSQNLNQCINNISAIKARLNAKMQAEGTTEEQKNKIQEMLDKLKEQEDKLVEIKNSTNLDPQTAYQKVSQIEYDVNKLVREALNVINGNTTTPETSTPGTSTPGTSTPGTSTPGTSTPGTSTPGTSTPTTTTTTTTQGTVDKFDDDVKAAVDQLHDAMYCPGTDDEKMEEVLNLVNKDNVMDLVLAWNKYHSAEKGESFMKAFMWDADSSQKEKYGKIMARALRDKAEELGIYSECREDFAKIDKEMGSWFYISNDVAESFDNIIAKIAKKIGSKYGKPQVNKEA